MPALQQWYYFYCCIYVLPFCLSPFSQVILNRDTNVQCDPNLLPQPDHVMVNHMYALSIKVRQLSTPFLYKSLVDNNWSFCR